MVDEVNQAAERLGTGWGEMVVEAMRGRRPIAWTVPEGIFREATQVAPVITEMMVDFSELEGGPTTMLEVPIATVVSDDLLPAFFADIFDKLSSGSIPEVTPEMLATLERVLTDDYLVGSIPAVLDILYNLFVMQEVRSYDFSYVESQFCLNMRDQTLDPFDSKDKVVIDSHSIRQQTLKMKEIITDKLVFI